jgi:hypothetical protein
MVLLGRYKMGGRENIPFSFYSPGLDCTCQSIERV